jgi:DNA-binding response OmpR family regulator
MPTEPLILAVDDEPAILRLVRIELTAQGFRVASATNGPDALRMLDEQRPDLVLLDILMEEMSGIEVLRRIRERANIPVIFLTAKGRDTDEVRGLELGADDYITKPFHPDELAARVRAVLRRSTSTSAPDNIVRAGSVEVDLTRRLVRKHGGPVPMTRTEWMLLELAPQPGDPHSQVLQVVAVLRSPHAAQELGVEHHLSGDSPPGSRDPDPQVLQVVAILRTPDLAQQLRVQHDLARVRGEVL